MYVIRRHSRKLFFPAGLLALAWLPVLGGALLAARPELRHRYRVMQVSMPLLKWSSAHFKKEVSISFPETYASAAQIDTMHPWHTVRFTGNPWQDNLSARTATFVAQQLKADPDQDRGLRIQFEKGSHYRSLVAMLGMFDTVGIKKFWLDTRYEPTTLYSYTMPPLPGTYWLRNLPLLSCGLSSPVPSVPAPPTWYQQLGTELAAAFRLSTWRPLFSPNWRYSTPLLLLLPLAAAWQLRRLHTANSRR